MAGRHFRCLVVCEIYHGFIEVRYVDLLWPGRWPLFRPKEGDFYITQAGELLRKGEPAAALFRLRAGVGKSLFNCNGRILLARLYLGYRRPDLARKLLLDGLRYLPADSGYLQTTLGSDRLLLHPRQSKLLAALRTALATRRP